MNQIVESNASGIYQHPFDKGQLLTLKFKGDDNAVARIIEDSHSLNSATNLVSSAINLSNFTDHVDHMLAKESYKGPKEMNSSVAIGEDLEDKAKGIVDINLVYVDKTPYEGMEEYVKNDQNKRYFALYVTLHEIFHSLKEQEYKESDLEDFVNGEGSRKNRLEMESDVGALLLVSAEIINETGSNEKALELIDYIINARMAGLDRHMAARNAPMSHFTSPALSVVRELVLSDPNKVSKLDDDSVRTVAIKVAISAIAHDFNGDIYDALAVKYSSQRDKLSSAFKMVQAKVSSDPEQKEFVLERLRTNDNKGLSYLGLVLSTNNNLLYKENKQEIDQLSLMVLKHSALDIIGKADIVKRNVQRAVSSLQIKDFPSFTEEVIDNIKEMPEWVAMNSDVKKEVTINTLQGIY